jgi:CarD family transcriptional regulator
VAILQFGSLAHAFSRFERVTKVHLTIGQKVAYPNQGVCLVEGVQERTFGTTSICGYTLRVLCDNSLIFVPEKNAESVGIRPLITSSQCRKLVDKLGEDFEPVVSDWKTRSREFTEKLRTGDVFKAADVLKMLTFLSHEKKLSFREQTLLDKARYLIVSELANAYRRSPRTVETEIVKIVEAACSKHNFTHPKVFSAAIH